MKRGALTLRQLDQRLGQEPRSLLPPRGWIASIREALGMSSTQLAKKLGITKQGLQNIEASERKGTISVSTLRRVAQVLGCEVKITLLPQQSLEAMIRQRAYEKARKILERTALHMNLEDQGTSSAFQEDQLRETAEELIRNRDRSLWED